MTSGTANRPRRHLPHWLVLTLVWAVSIGILIWVFHGFDWRQTVLDMRAMDWRYVTIAVIFDLLVYVVHGWRWSLLLQPVAPARLWRTVQAVYIGLYANEILPLRTGEVVRCYLVAHWNKLPLSTALSSAAMERVLDGIWLVLGFWFVTLFLTVPGYLVVGTEILAVIVVALAGVVLYIAMRKQHAHDAVPKGRWSRTLRNIIDGIHAMGNPATLSVTFAVSLLYLGLQLVPVWALIRGYGLDLSVWAAAAVLVILRLGTAIPNAPGNAGVFQGVVVLGLGLFGVPKGTAVGFSLMMFGVLTLPLLIGGFVAVLLTGVKLEELRRRAEVSFARQAEVPSEP
ncbi:MAG: flippase-like domain-containing protein [Bryobacterales bacterium]|nr:flippase-like domain-containing protein [Bryobacterales bacterium]